MRLSELLSSPRISCERSGADVDPVITGITFDSREAGQGVLFVALVGASMDGHDFVRRAVGAGASAILVEGSQAVTFDQLGVPVVAVDDTRAALPHLASRFHGHPSRHVDVIGVTGTNGKTTVSFLLEAVLNHAGRACGVLGTVNYRWPGTVIHAPNTTPESLVVQRLLAQMLADGVRAVAMEVSSHGLATHRVEGTSFDVAVFTNLSQDHLDFHASMEAYRDAKRTLFSVCLRTSQQDGKNPTAVINIDDAEGRALAELDLVGEVVTTSAEGQPADWRCTSWDQRLEGTVMRIESPVGGLELQTRLLGRFNASNVLQTLAATHSVGVDVNLAIEALSELRGVPGRLQHLGGAGKPHVFVDYAHTPDALQRALQALRPLTTGTLTAVFGCGGDRDRAKRPMMGRVAADEADFVVLTSDNPRSESPAAIVGDIEPAMGGTPWMTILDRRDAIAQTIANAGSEDVILIAGKGHETYQEVGGERRPFDDVAEAHLALQSLP